MKKVYLLFLLVTALGVSSFNKPVPVPDELVKIVQVYPNPATSIINFEFSHEVVDKSYTFQVYSFGVGRKMNELSITTSKITLNLDAYTRGLYFFQLRDKAGQIIESGKFQVVK